MVRCIHSHSTMPPMLCDSPADDRGLTGNYWPATPQGAREALEYHRLAWSDWAIDPAIVALADSL